MVKNRIAQFRRDNSMNQRELGEKLGVGQTTVSAWETGRNEPDSDSLSRMAKLFHTTIGYLMGYEAESYLHGLTPGEYEQLESEKDTRRAVARWQKQTQQDECGLTEDEIEEYQRYADMERWESSGSPDTLEGFLVSEMVDNLPEAMRQLALSTMRNFAKAVSYTSE